MEVVKSYTEEVEEEIKVLTDIWNSLYKSEQVTRYIDVLIDLGRSIHRRQNEILVYNTSEEDLKRFDKL